MPEREGVSLGRDGGQGVGGGYPAEFGEAAGPTAEGEDAEPDENAAFDPVGEAGEDARSFLGGGQWEADGMGMGGRRLTKKRPKVAMPVLRAMKPRMRMTRSTLLYRKMKSFQKREETTPAACCATE